ncbi:hypothetical protein FHX34_107175 [Actinoplanes teichomyceticus]|uniref:Uncharacterized protein n=1 Tax=Actinoplanes teichomyceticus TaxID=1867 RepID=A0A561VGE6_ACTTI|nr:hypothetical protein FHX34_107175 [Actinoplanes teichomyceticus]
MVDNEFRAGDVLQVSCVFTEARVTNVASGHVSIRWPWNAHPATSPTGLRAGDGRSDVDGWRLGGSYRFVA